MGDSPVAVPYNSSGTEIATAANPARVDPTGTTTQPVSGTVTANLGTIGTAATAAKQDTGNSSLSSIDGKLTSLGQKTMTGSVPVTIASNQSAVPVAPTVIPNPTDVTGSISALNGVVTCPQQGWSSCAITVTGTWAAVLVFELSADGGTTWILGGFITSPTELFPIPKALSYLTVNGTYQAVGLGPNTHVRLRAAQYVSGTANVRFTLSASPAPILTAIVQAQQNVVPSLYNSSTTNLAVGTSFTGTAESTLGVSAIRISTIASQPILITLDQSTDGANWDVSDVQLFQSGSGDGRTFQVVASYFRVIATNIGNATTSYFRMQSSMCPILETVPRALTPDGKLRLSGSTRKYAPDPTNFTDEALQRSLRLDKDNQLMSRSTVLTDEQGFRDDFTSANIYTDLTGTCYFTNGSVYVTGVGTLFLSELTNQRYLKLSSHADSVYVRVAEVHSDTLLTLESAYTGATASGTGRSSFWKYTIDTGAGITQTGSEILLASGTTSGSLAQAKRYGDYAPTIISFLARITQRIANQEAAIGAADGDYGSVQGQTLVVFDGTTNTVVKLRTSTTSGDVETTTITLPGGATTATAALYTLEIYSNRVTLFYNGVKVGENQSHIPAPYNVMDYRAYIKNTGVAGSTTTLALNVLYYANFNRLQIATIGKGDPVTTKELRAGTSVCTSVAGAAADTQLLTVNNNRLGACIVNDSSSILYVKFGTGASSSSYTVRMTAYAYYEVPFGYTGQINGYWAVATGNARVTEVQ